MYIVLLTALGVGGATVIGSLLGFAFKNISHKFSDVVLSFAAGVMLAASVLGLILPSLRGRHIRCRIAHRCRVLCSFLCGIADRSSMPLSQFFRVRG